MSEQIDLQEEILNLTQKLIEAEKEIVRLNQNVIKSENRVLQERELNQNFKSQLSILDRFPDLEEQRIRMQYELELAKQFSDAKAFGDYRPEQIYTMMKCGEEMGLKPIESLQMLYIVNGKIKPYGDKMVAIILKNGYRIEYLNESLEGVDVRVYNDSGFDVTEKVSAKDPVFINSKAYKFAPKNKMRFHGVRMFVSYHLAHLFGSVSDEFSAQYADYEEVKEDQPKKLNKFKSEDENNELAEIEKAIKACESLEELEAYKNENKAILSKNVALINLIGSMKKELSKKVEE